MSQVLFTTSSNCWLAGLPTLPAALPSARPAGEEDAAKLTGEQPSTSSDTTSGYSSIHALNVEKNSKSSGTTIL